MYDKDNEEEPKPINGPRPDYKAKQVEEYYDESDEELAELGIRIKGVNRKSH